jgi:hypothetical protein
VPRLMRRTLVLALALAACGRSIGDDCETNVQCDPQGARQCDLSQPGGYCTVEGCDISSCPDDAVCVRFFPIEALTMDCSAGPDVCSGRDICLPDEKFCVDSRLEHRFCMKPCEGDGDCREGYVCRRTAHGGEDLGAELLPNDKGQAGQAKFCIERPVGEPGPNIDAPPLPDAGPADAPESSDGSPTD